VLLQTNNPTPDFSSGSLDCDDWCHAWVSPVVPTGSSAQDTFITAAFSGNFYKLFYSSLSIPPPFHPPIP
ncbi:MAG: hypothetical protein SV201_15980, partial [Pseudomonadota bacterium]|nr:hypothetical protein [Pseudomonadota bacterium]